MGLIIVCSISSPAAQHTQINSTGVSFADVAGVDHAVEAFKQINELMTGDPRYATMGATLPKVHPCAP